MEIDARRCLLIYWMLAGIVCRPFRFAASTLFSCVVIKSCIATGYLFELGLGRHLPGARLALESDLCPKALPQKPVLF